MKKFWSFIGSLFNNETIIEFIVYLLGKLDKRFDNIYFHKAVEVITYLLTDDEAENVIDEIFEIIEEKKSK